MLDFFISLLTFAGCFFTIFGLYIFFVPMIKMKAPMDRSNIWNALTAVVYVAFRPFVFGKIKFFKNDVGENIRLVEQAVKEENENNT